VDPRKLQGWHADPSGLHERRYFSAGSPTKLVRDGDVESYDEPVLLQSTQLDIAAASSVPPTGSTAGAADVSPSAPARRRPGLAYGAVAVISAAVAVAVFVVVGGRSQNTESNGADPAAFVSQSAQKTLALKTADITVAGMVSDAGVAGDQGNAVALHGIGEADFAADTLATTFSMSYSGTTLVENEIVTSRYLYLQLTVHGRSMAQYPGGLEWFAVPLALSLTQSSTRYPVLCQVACMAEANPDWFLRVLAQPDARITPMGSQKVGGLNCSQYRVTPTRQALLAAAHQESAKLGLSASWATAIQQTLEKMTPALTVWLDPNRQITCQLAVYLQVSTEGLAGWEKVPSTIDAPVLMTFTHYGVPVTITPPARSHTISN
jgi:hypothetical protein